MKIGIVTFPTAINYGTALQAAALGNVLKEKNHEISFLDHRCSLIDSTNSIFDIKHILNIKYTLAHLYNMREAIQRKNNFSLFQQRHIQLGTDTPENYDIIVAGSDQIWNYNLTENDWFYFLDFTKKNTKKVAYAASFGLSSIDTQHKDKINLFLKDFDFLSVREKTAVDIINDLSDIDVPVVLDPTLLITRNSWKNMTKTTEKDSGYIFVYTVFNSDKIWEYAKFLSNKTGLPIKTISYSKLHRHNAIYNFTAGPDDWVNYMLNADYVVTNSFHGVAFSINFNKNFFFDMPPEKAGVGSRISDITERYSLSHRNISAPNFVETAEAPDFSAANKLLEEDRFFSFSFIDSFLNSKSAPEEE